MFGIKGQPNRFDYAVQLQDRQTKAITGNLTALVENPLGFYSAKPTIGASQYWAHYYRGTEYLGYEEYDWDGNRKTTTALLNEAIATRSSHTAADITTPVLADTAAIGTLLQAVSDRASESRLANLETVARTATANEYKATGFATNSGVWANATRSLTDKDGFALSTQAIADVVSGVWSATGRTLTGFGNLVDSVWDFATRGLTEPVATDIASQNASKADVSTIETQVATLFGLVSGGSFTTIALQNAPTGSGSGSGLTPEQSGILTTLRGLVDEAGDEFKATALVNAPSSGSGGLLADERSHLLGIPQNPLLAGNYTAPPALADITFEINQAESAIIAEGTAAWQTATGFNTIAPDNDGVLNAIASVITHGDAEWPTATGFNTVAPDNAGILSAVVAAKDEVLAEGTASWQSATGFNTLAPDNAGILNAIATLNNAPVVDIGPLTTTVNAIASVIPEERAAKLDRDLAHVGNADTFKSTGFNTVAPDNSGILDAIGNIISRGDTAWTTADVSTIGPQVATLFGLVSGDSFTSVALQNAPSGSGTGGGLLADERSHLFGIPQNPLLDTDYTSPPSLAPILAAIDGTESAIIAEGSKWVTATGFATVNPDNDGILNAIASKAVTPVTDLSPVIAAIDNKAVTPAVDIAAIAQEIQIRTEPLLDLAEGDKEFDETGFQIYKRGTEIPLIPVKVITRNGENVTVKQL